MTPEAHIPLDEFIYTEQRDVLQTILNQMQQSLNSWTKKAWKITSEKSVAC
jgi:hypothetical protein